MKKEIIKLLPNHIFSYCAFFEDPLIENLDLIEIMSNHKRFDLVAKYIYAYFVHKKINTKWAYSLYVAHIKSFNNFKEDENSIKAGREEYLDDFNDLILKFENGSFQVNKTLIPLDEDNCPLDGAHRLALAYLFDIELPTIKMKRLKPHNSHAFDYSFFINKGLSLKYADYIALSYAQQFKNTYILCLFPSASDYSDVAEEVIKGQANIFYAKEIYLTSNGKKNVIRQIYDNEKWLGDYSNKYSGVNFKVSKCFTSPSPLKVYLISVSEQKNLIEIKKEIRAICKVGNHSVHINDYHKQTVTLAKLFFNQNSIDYINNITLFNFSKFHALFDELKLSHDNNCFNSDFLCVDGSAVLSAHGLRDCYDIDFLHYEQSDIPTFTNPLISCHNDNFYEHKFHQKLSHLDEFIFNPENYFYLNGIKFITLPILRKMKAIRNESKDIVDIALIDKYLNTKTSYKDVTFPIKVKVKAKSNHTNKYFYESYKYWRETAREEWYDSIRNVKNLHPKISVDIPEYFIDRYAFRLYLSHQFGEDYKSIQIPDFDFESETLKWLPWLENHFVGLPSFNHNPPSLNARIPFSYFLEKLLLNWREFVNSFGIKTNEEFCKNPAGLYWFEYFQKSVYFPLRPAMWGPTFFYKLSNKQQRLLVQKHGLEGIVDLFIFILQTHEESHLIQKGEPMLCEFMHSWLWCRFIKQYNYEYFQINDEDGVSCNIERPWSIQVDLTKDDVKRFFEDTQNGVLSYFTNPISYDNLCLLAWLFDKKAIKYSEYLDKALDCFNHSASIEWQGRKYTELIQLAKSLDKK